MGIIHAVRSDSATFDARFSYGGKTPGFVQQNSAVNPPLYEADATAIGGNRINMDRGSAIARAIVWNAMKIKDVSTSRAISVLVRLKLGANGAALGIWSRDGNIMNWGTNRITIHVNASNQWIANGTNEYGQTTLNAINFGTQNVGTANWVDVVFTWDGTTTANAAKLYIDGVLLGSGTASAALNATFDWRSCTSLALGGVSGANNARMYVNEFVVWDSVIDPTNITLTSGAGGSLNGSARTAFVDVTAFDGISSSDPGIANVKTGIGYTINGTSLTGTYTGADRWSDPGAANVLSATSYLANGVTQTGSYNPPTSTNPGAANVVSGISYIINGSTFTGSLSIPQPVVVDSALDIGALKDVIKDTLDTNNVAVGAPVADLSANMSKRVQKVLTVNPEDIMPTANLMPAVCIYTASKTPRPRQIGMNQVAVKREARVVITIAGLVWNQNFQANVYDDKASRDLEYLMENLEKVLRGYAELGGAKWQFPSEVTYHSASLDEQTHFKVGFIDVEFVYYY